MNIIPFLLYFVTAQNSTKSKNETRTETRTENTTKSTTIPQVNAKITNSSPFQDNGVSEVVIPWVVLAINIYY